MATLTPPPLLPVSLGAPLAGVFRFHGSRCSPAPPSCTLDFPGISSHFSPSSSSPSSPVEHKITSSYQLNSRCDHSPCFHSFDLSESYDARLVRVLLLNEAQSSCSTCDVGVGRAGSGASLNPCSQPLCSPLKMPQSSMLFLSSHFWSHSYPINISHLSLQYTSVGILEDSSPLPHPKVKNGGNVSSFLK